MVVVVNGRLYIIWGVPRMRSFEPHNRIEASGFTVGSEKLECGSKMIASGFPSFLGLDLSSCSNILASTLQRYIYIYVCVYIYTYITTIYI